MAEADLVGTVLDGRYRIDEHLGRGGMATVYLAWQETLRRKVVVKVPHPGLIEQQEFVARFEREVRKLTELRHPRIVAVLEAGDLDGTPYVVMEHLSGGTLKDRLETCGTQSPVEVLEWLFPVAEALDFVHAQGVIHRDVKPGNILFDDHGNAFVSDFGLAKVLGTADSKITRTGTTLGTVLYMSPEAGRSRPLSGASDQYGLAVIVYEALGGRVPFDGDTPVSIMLKKLNEDPEEIGALCPELGSRAASAIMKALSRIPGQRHSSCTKFARALAGSMSESSVEATPPSRTEEATPVTVQAPASVGGPPVRSRMRLVSAVLLLAALAALGYLVLVGTGSGPPAEEGPARDLTGGSEYADRLLADFRELARAGPPVRHRRRVPSPDLAAYLESHARFRFLCGLVLGASQQGEIEGQEQHLDHLVRIAESGSSSGTPSLTGVRLVLLLTQIPEEARRGRYAGEIAEIEGDFDRHLLAWIDTVEAWEALIRQDPAPLASNVSEWIAQLAEACRSHRAIPHDRPEAVYKAARAIRESLSALESPAMRERVEGFLRLCYGAETVEDLRAFLDRLEGTAESEASERAGSASAWLGSSDGLEVALKTDQLVALVSLAEYLEDVLTLGVPESDFSPAISAADLASHQSRILAEIESAERKVWMRLRPLVERLTGESATAEDGTRKAGWWATLVDLTRAKEADARQTEYLEKGLRPFLAAAALGRTRTRENPDETFTVTRMEEVVLPRLAGQMEFFRSEPLAASIRKEALGLSTPAFEQYLSEMEEHWTRRFLSAVPAEPASSIMDLYKHLGFWTDPRSELLLVAAEIESAIHDVRGIRARGEAQDLLRSTERQRRDLFEKFIICFVKDEGPGSYSIAEAAKPFERLQRILEPAAGDFGAMADRPLLLELIKGLRIRDPVEDSMKSLRLLRLAGSAESLGKRLADWMEPGVNNLWSWLVPLAVERTAQDINREWSRRVQDWQKRIVTGGRPTFQAIFGRDGEFSAFRKEYLEPFFEIPGYQWRLQGVGARLLVEPAFQELESKLESPDLATGAWRKDTLELKLGLGGTLTAESLYVEYVSEKASIRSMEFRNFEPVGLHLVWSPSTCRRLRFIVDLGGGEVRELSWSGPWAVANALASARREGDTYIWKQEEQGRGTWEVRLGVTGETALVKYFAESGGRATAAGPIGEFPPEAVRVVK